LAVAPDVNSVDPTGCRTLLFGLSHAVLEIVEQQQDETVIDGILEDSFPASDPPSWTLGVHTAEPSMQRSNDNQKA
jgi:hypothetical protein